LSHRQIRILIGCNIILFQNSFQTSDRPCQDYFYSLKNVTFCGFHPADSQYFGFVTKHPQMSKYACHVFVGMESTQHVAEACGYVVQINQINRGGGALLGFMLKIITLTIFKW
jgi:hypothetical protein